MAKQFEFRLIDGTAPQGQLEADDLLALVQSLKEVATKLGRDETETESVGRPTKETRRLSKLTIGLAPGSTRVLVKRAATDSATLDFDLAEERSFDERFEKIVSAVALDARPEWLSASLAIAVGKLRTALEAAAPRVEFSVDGQVKQNFATSETSKLTWLTDDEPLDGSVTFVGRLRAVNLDSHRFRVVDDVGNRVELVDVENDGPVGRLLDEYVTVVGLAEWDAKGRLSHIHRPEIEADAAAPGLVGARATVPIDEILARAAGPREDGIADLTEAEATAFLEAIGG